MAISTLTYLFFLCGFNFVISGLTYDHTFNIKQDMTITNYHRNKVVYARSRITCGAICGQDPECGAATMNRTSLLCSLNSFTQSILYPLILRPSPGLNSLLRSGAVSREVPQGYTYNQALKFWFKVVDTPESNAMDAKTTCYNDGAYLILIDSQAVLTFVTDTIVKHGLSKIYFQGYRESDSDPFVDDENNPLTYFAWQPTGAGSGSYIRTNSEYLMEASGGTTKRSYICQLHA